MLPTFMAGLPIAGKVLDQQIYAANIGLWKAELFVGVLVHRDLLPAAGATTNSTPSVAGTAGSLQARWGTRLTYGINIPISMVKSALSSKSSSNNTNSTSSQSSKKAPSSPAVGELVMAAVLPTMGDTFGCIMSQDGILGFFAAFPDKTSVPFAVTCSHSLAPAAAGQAPKPTSDLANQGDVQASDRVYLPRNIPLSEYVIGARVWATSLSPDTPVVYDCRCCAVDHHANAADRRAVDTDRVWIDDALPDQTLLVANGQQIPGKPGQTPAPSPALSVPGRDGVFTYTNLYSIDYGQPGQVTWPIAEGMSGAPIITPAGMLVGMHIAGEGSTGYFRATSCSSGWACASSGNSGEIWSVYE